MAMVITGTRESLVVEMKCKLNASGPWRLQFQAAFSAPCWGHKGQGARRKTGSHLHRDVAIFPLADLGDPDQVPCIAVLSPPELKPRLIAGFSHFKRESLFAWKGGVFFP